MKLILTRHGETEQNKLGIAQGHLDSVLSAHGKEQSKKLAARLAKEQIDIIYTSDLKRALHTAEEIAKHHPQAQLIITKELREIDIGAFTGKYLKDIDWSNPPPDHEGDEKLYERSKKFILSLAEKHKGQTVLCVAHGRINMAIIAALTGKTHHEMDTIPPPHNTSVNILELDDRSQWNMVLLNDVTHLE